MSAIRTPLKLTPYVRMSHHCQTRLHLKNQDTERCSSGSALSSWLFTTLSALETTYWSGVGSSKPRFVKELRRELA